MLNTPVPADGAAMPETTFLPVTSSMRQKLEATVDALLGLLDEFDGDADLEDTKEDDEDTHDAEPSIGVCSYTAEGKFECDLEFDRTDDEHELGWQDEGSQASLQGSLYDGEPSLGWTGHGQGWREGETTDDRELVNEDGREDSLDGGRTEHGIADADALHSEELAILAGRDGGINHDGSGTRIAKKLLKEHARKKQSAGTKGEVLFRREEPIANLVQPAGWNSGRIGHLPPEAFEVLVPDLSMYKAAK